MDIEAVLAITFLFGGGTLVGLGYSPVGKALADRIRGKSASTEDLKAELAEQRDATEGELEMLRTQVSELAERLDFAERLLANQKGRDRLGGGAA